MSEKFKVGDLVRCIGTGHDGGSGWEKGKIFTIDHMIHYDGRIIVWPCNENYGVYADHLEHVYSLPIEIDDTTGKLTIPDLDIGSCPYSSDDLLDEKKLKKLADKTISAMDQFAVSTLSSGFCSCGTDEPAEKKPMNCIQKLLLGADEKTLIEAGYIDTEMNLTGKGTAALLSIVFAANKPALVEMAKEEVAEAKDEK